MIDMFLFAFRIQYQVIFWLPNDLQSLPDINDSPFVEKTNISFKEDDVLTIDNVIDV
jgi:hypothetical protein